MKKSLSLVCLGVAMLLPSVFWAQTVRVKDAQTGEPLCGVTLSATGASAVTDLRGQVDVSAFEGVSDIEVRSVGYHSQRVAYNALLGGELLLSPANFDLDEVVVSATRWSQPLSQTPQRIVSFSQTDVLRQQPQTAADLLNATGYVFMQKSQLGGGSPMIRGFATNRLLYSVDGVRMNTAIFRSGNLQNVISLDPLAIERTEVLFGPNSVIYGSDAIGGVMSFTTLTPRLATGNQNLYLGGSALARYSSANSEKTGHFDVNVGGRKWSSLTSVTYSDYGDLMMGSFGPDDYLCRMYVARIDGKDVTVENKNPRVQVPTGYSQFNVMQKFRFDPTDNLHLQYNFHYSTTSDYARYDRHIELKNAEWNYGPQKWMMHNFDINHTGNNVVYDEMDIKLAYQLFEESRIDRKFDKSKRRTRDEHVDAYSLNIDFIKRVQRNTIMYGAEAVFNNVFSRGTDQNIETNVITAGAPRYPRSLWASYAVYLADRFQINKRVGIEAGVRYNHYQMFSKFDTTFYPFPFTEAKVNNGAVTGQLGVVYHPSPSWTLSLNASTGFRSPNVDDMGKVFDPKPGSVIVPNPALRSEYIYNVDLGVSKVICDVVKLDLTAYYSYLDHAIVSRDFTLNGLDSMMYDGKMSRIQALQNAAYAQVVGVQAGVEARLPLGFGLSSVVSYQYGEEVLDDGSVNPLRHAPPVFGNGKFTYNRKKLYLELSVDYSGEVSYAKMPQSEIGKDYMYAKDKDGNPYSPSWYSLNFRASYQVMKHLTVNAAVENLTDQRYRPYSSGIAAAGRNFVLSLRANF